MFVKIDEYKGKPSMQLLRNEDDEYAVHIGGAGKYNSMIVAFVENAEDILQFVEKNHGERGVETARKFREKFGLQAPPKATNGAAKKSKKPERKEVTAQQS
jgi:hypothetical protein